VNWKKLKLFAIVLLLLMNGWFLFRIAQRNYSAMHYEKDLITASIGVFRKSELYVDRSFLEKPIRELPVYTGSVDENSEMLLAITHTLSNRGYQISKEINGVRFTDVIGEFYFGDDFSFYYKERAHYEMPSTLLATERYIRLTPENRYRQDAFRVASDFMSRYLASGDERHGFRIFYSEVYSSGVNYIVTLTQRIDGVPIYGEICRLVSGGRVTAADGLFVTSTPTRKETAQTTDLVNILFMEKAFLDARYREGGSFSYTPMVLSKAVYSYAVYFDATGTFYFVPLCTVTYMNGETRSYNCVSGKLYS
jgi:hypothetical protein